MKTVNNLILLLGILSILISFETIQYYSDTGKDTRMNTDAFFSIWLPLIGGIASLILSIISLFIKDDEKEV